MIHSQMIKVHLFILFACIFTTGLAQVTMTISNRSSGTIDSIVVELMKPFTIGPIEKNSSKTFFVSVNQANFHSIAPFSFSVYSDVLNAKMQWQKTGFVDTIYFFDHGLSSVDREPRRPETFVLYVFNATPSEVDTIIAPNNSIVQMKEYTPRSFDVILDHQKLSPEQVISFQLGQKVFKANLRACKFNDWNNFSCSLYIDKDSIFTGSHKDSAIYEFVAEFEMREGLSSKDIRIESKYLLKTYVDDRRKFIRAVFDYPRFKSDPQFKVRIGRKTHVIRLKNKEAEYKQYYITRSETGECDNCVIIPFTGDSLEKQ